MCKRESDLETEDTETCKSYEETLQNTKFHNLKDSAQVFLRGRFLWVWSTLSTEYLSTEYLSRRLRFSGDEDDDDKGKYKSSKYECGAYLA